jgi:hypothetical protein
MMAGIRASDKASNGSSWAARIALRFGPNGSHDFGAGIADSWWGGGQVKTIGDLVIENPGFKVVLSFYVSSFTWPLVYIVGLRKDIGDRANCPEGL